VLFLYKLLKVVSVIPTLIEGAEKLFGAKSGNDKKNFVLTVVGLALNITEAVSNRDIVDEKKFSEGLNETIDGIVKMLNASVWRKQT
jgi:hypothetical protein